MTLTYKETSLSYTDIGKGKPLVLLHGFLENISMWNDISEVLSQTHRVISIDLLGHGKTDCLGYVHTMENMAEAVHYILEYLQIQQSYFVGHSMGGYVALAFAEKYTSNVKGICLMNSTTQEDTEERKEIRKRASKMAKKNLHPLIKMSVANLFTLQSKAKFATAIEKMAYDASTISVRGYIAANEGMRLRKNQEETFTKVNKRLIITGKQDTILPLENIQKEAERTSTVLKELSNGHMSHIEDKDEIINILKDFLQ
jgi:pimeloyl-ACP methyl ester carboxylesterase